MPLFELDDGRLVPAQYGRPVHDPIEPAAVDAVREQVLEIVGRPLLPILRHDSAAAPDALASADLVALDPNGRTVAVTITPRIDAESVLAALGRAGTAARLTWSEIARRYHRGEGAFGSDWATFRETAARGESGPPAVLVGFEAEDSVRPALEVLSGAGLQVIDLVVRATSDGRRFIDATDLHRDAAPSPHRVLTPAAPRRAIAGGAVRQAGPDAETPPGGIDAEPSADLALIGAALPSAVDLSWVAQDDGAARPGRPAVLTPEGTIVLPDGQVVTDPDAGARIFGAPEGADGWTAWRIGTGGPTLAEARTEMRAAAARRPSRTGPAISGSRRRHAPSV